MITPLATGSKYGVPVGAKIRRTSNLVGVSGICSSKKA
jgi:hypothetical protein